MVELSLAVLVTGRSGCWLFYTVGCYLGRITGLRIDICGSLCVGLVDTGHRQWAIDDPGLGRDLGIVAIPAVELASGEWI